MLQLAALKRHGKESGASLIKSPATGSSETVLRHGTMLQGIYLTGHAMARTELSIAEDSEKG